MKILQVVPKADALSKLKSLLKEKERNLRGGSTTFFRQKEGRWKHVRYAGWINWNEAAGGILVAEIQSKVEGSEWQLLQSFVGYLVRHLGDHIESIQGVLDVVNMTGTLAKPFAGLTEVGKTVHLQWVISFPWLPKEGKFKGETIYSIRPL